MKPKVGIKRIGDFSKRTITKAFCQWVPKVISNTELTKTNKIVIKVNLCAPVPPETGAITDPRVVEGLVEYIIRVNSRAKVFIVESDTGTPAELRFNKANYNLLEKRHDNVKLVNLSRTKQVLLNDYRLTFFTNGLRISSIFQDCFFISIAKLKTHEFERFTGVLKNQFGCLSYKRKAIYHPYLSDVIADVNTLIRPRLCIIDGLIAMEGRGPTAGKPKRMGLLIIGNDPVAVDATGAYIMGIKPSKIPHLKKAAKRGLGEINLQKIEICGDDPESVREPFTVIPELTYRLLRLSFKIQMLALPLGIKTLLSDATRRFARLFCRYGALGILGVLLKRETLVTLRKIITR